MEQLSEVGSWVTRAIEWLGDIQWLWLFIIGLIAVFCVTLLVRAIMNRRKRGWDVFYFLFLTMAVLVWSVFAFLAEREAVTWLASFYLMASSIGRVFVPGLLCLHIWKQVSYKNITPLVVVLCLAAPLVLAAWQGYALAGAFGGPQPGQPNGLWWYLLYFVYAFAALLKCYLLCFNVFYQMPRHMRRSAYYMLVAVTITLVANFFALAEAQQSGYHLSLLATGIAMYFLYEAFFAASSANVIVTSRDFVFGNLSTMILVLSRSYRILDWNKKTPEALGSLPRPKYREAFDSYRQRMIEEGNGRVSPHGDNILITSHGGAEKQYLVTLNEVRNVKRRFGYIAEIGEITNVYRVLRLMEDIATIDQMTGLLNRNAYLATVQRYVEEGVVPLVVVGDVNKLKKLNDTLGHLVGDELLKCISGIIRTHLPQGSYAYRIGGDEFVVLMPGAPVEQAYGFIEAVNASCAATHSELYGTPSISWGYAVRENVQQDYNDVFYDADQIMYNAKKQHFQFTSSGMVPNAQRQKAPEAAGQPQAGPFGDGKPPDAGQPGAVAPGAPSAPEPAGGLAEKPPQPASPQPQEPPE